MIASTIIILKLMAQGWMTVFRMIESDAGLLNPEDLREGPANRNPRPEQLEPNAYVEQSRRIHRNDLESIPAFLVCGLLFVAVRPSPWLAQVLMYTFVIARLGHTRLCDRAAPRASCDAPFDPPVERERQVVEGCLIAAVLLPAVGGIGPHDGAHGPDPCARWSDDASESRMKALESSVPMEGVLDAIRGLAPQTETQSALRAQAVQLCNELLITRWLQIEQAQTPLPRAFLAILFFWLTMLYTSFGLIAPRNAAVIAVLLVGALSLGTAIFLVLEMNDPMGAWSGRRAHRCGTRSSTSARRGPTSRITAPGSPTILTGDSARLHRTSASLFPRSPPGFPAGRRGGCR